MLWQYFRPKYKLSSLTLQVQVVKDKQSGDVFAMKTLNKTQTLAQESVSTEWRHF